MSTAPYSPAPAVAVTRPEEEEEGEDRLSRFIRREGMRPLSFPLMALAPPTSPGALNAAAKRLVEALHRGESPPYTWIVITSRNVISPFLDAVRRAGGHPEALRDAGLRVAAVGQPTATTLEGVGLPPDLVPTRYTAEDLLEALRERGGIGEGSRILLPRAEVARDVLPEGIRDLGGNVDVVTAYRVVEDRAGARALCQAVRREAIQGVTLTSGRAARLLGATWASVGGGSWPRTVRVGVIGPVTAEATRKAGLPVDGIPEEATLPALAKAMARTLGVSE
jgi:uroporphyrinogen III methyltransferase / synthase